MTIDRRGEASIENGGRALPRTADRAGERWTDVASSWWTLLGVSALLGAAVYRLGGRGVSTIREGLGELEWVALVALTGLFVYGEGFRALERRWVPIVVQRARSIRRDRRLLVRLLAPLYGLSLIGASRSSTVRAWAGMAAIGVAVIVVQSFPAPWRGITDFAVAAALAWGLGAIVRAAPRALG